MLELFKIWDCGQPKKRYGNDYDGGYVIIDGLKYDLFLSAGIGSNMTFECDFSRNIKTHLFDITLQNRIKDNVSFHKLLIKDKTTDLSTNLHEYLSKNKDVFIKMDIEGGECEWLDALPLKLQKNIKQIVIEFHGAENSFEYIRQLQKTHSLVHIHGNNYSPMVTIEGHGFPHVYECTFVRTADFPDIKLSENKYPCPLDMPNNPHSPEINLDYL